MSGASPATEWHCTVCSFFLDIPHVPPASMSSRCGNCGNMADPCGVLRIELATLRGEIQRREAIPPGAIGASADGSSETGSEMMTAKEAAEHLKLPSVQALYMAVRRLTVPAHRFGKRGLRFKRAELDAVLEARR